MMMQGKLAVRNQPIVPRGAKHQGDRSIDSALESFNMVVTKNYLSTIGGNVALKPDADAVKELEFVRADAVTKIVYDKSEDSRSKLNALFSALYSARSSVFIVLRNAGDRAEFFIGVKSGNPINDVKVLERAMAGNFPGCVMEERNELDVKDVSDYLRSKKHNYVGVVTGIPSLHDNGSKEFSQGLEKIIDAMGDREYIAVLLGTPVLREELEKMEAGYSNIYSALSLMDISSYSVSEQYAKTYSKSINESITESLTRSVGLTVSHTENQSHTEGKSHTESNGSSDSVGVSAYGVIAPLGVGGGGGVSYSHSWTHTDSDTKTESNTTGEANTEAQTESEAAGLAKMRGVGQGESDSLSNGATTQYAIKNRNVQGWLETLNAQIERIKTAKDFGAWNWAAYFVAPSEEAVGVGTHIYSGLLRGEKSGTERNAVAIWKRSQLQFENIIDALSVFDHPVFELSDKTHVTPTSLIGTSEMSIAMSLPRKSIPGIPVFDSVEFGRSVTTFDVQDDDRVKVGSIFHLGKVEKTFRLGKVETNDVELCVNSLASHLFVTGSTGTGKSNFLYSLLYGLRTAHGEGKKGVRFLVIEPAKGEYKKVFGDMRGVKVYGTNPYETELLRVNPFSFPDGIHVMEHIDRLIEILNAAWPMYAAMPAILKDAVEQTYKKLGWDLVRSTCVYDKRVYPDFYDLLKILPEVINASAYDQEVKSNYTGSLLTRLKSLTNGYYRTIFQKDELPPADLFDSSCIVDISRVGSTETKSLLMGILFLKLQEYRMANSPKCNSGLRHITVLEEAHNLLRRTSTEQGMESANLAGKSVEMLTNAIAEMRTYGEGFVIADQAPGLLDPAVIRNTNTKVVFRLPDYDDRLLVGKAENLSDEQINELARLPTGCAAVYQNNWQEAVLCQMEKFGAPPKPLDVSRLSGVTVDSRTKAEGIRIKTLLNAVMRHIDFQDAQRLLAEEDRSLINLYFPAMFGSPAAGDGNPIEIFYNELIRPAVLSIPSEKKVDVWMRNLLVKLYAIDAVAALTTHDKNRFLKVTFKALADNDKHEQQKHYWMENEKKIENWRMWK